MSADLALWMFPALMLMIFLGFPVAFSLMGYEDNADAHLKRSVMGREVVVAVTDGKLDFGPWEQIFYGEFDGKRRKRVLVKIIGE